MPTPRRALAFAVALLLPIGVAACGDDASSTSGTGAANSAAATSDGLPTVTGAFGATPTIAIPKTDPPKDLKVVVLTKGTGPKVAVGDNLTANYVGQVWATGAKFDSSFDRGEPATFPVGVNSLIAGWDETLPGQTYGSRVLLVIPPEKGYGSGGNPQAGISGTDVLVFVVDLIEKAG